MQAEDGDTYVRRIAAFIRSHEKSLAAAQLARVRQAEPLTGSVLNPFNWLGASAPPPSVVLAFDTHHLYYLLIRLEGIGLSVGSLDIPVSNPSRPMDYIDFSPKPDHSDALSFASIRSTLSVVSTLSLGASWWRNAQPPSTDSELKYLFSSFTKLPALSIQPPGPKMIAELQHNTNTIPLHCFRNLQSLECVDIDPRVLSGWDLLSVRLRSLRIKRSGLTNLCDLFIGAIPPTELNTHSPTRKWGLLRFLSLSDNAITFLPSDILPYFTSITHLDLSCNLLVSVPHGLDTLVHLTTLNLAHNMIDSLLGVYTTLGQVQAINLSHNRIESICGLERLLGLEKVDLRGNMIDESSEIGRLALLPHIAQVWVEGNFFCEYEDTYRVECFSHFHKEGKTILLDGSPPSFYEKQSMQSTQESHSIPRATDSKLPSAPSPPTTTTDSSSASMEVRKVAHSRKKKPKRVIDLSATYTPRRLVPEAQDAPLSLLSSKHERHRSEAPVASESHRLTLAQGQTHLRRGSESLVSGLEHPDLFRQQMEHLKQDMGEGWLKVFSQSQATSTTDMTTG